MSVWGSLDHRYGSQTTNNQRKILSLDGGGIRGVLSLQILLEIESQLRQKLGRDETFTFSDYFDYIGGTSTGAIIAAGLSLGMPVQKLIDFYNDKGEAMFDKAFLFKRVKYFYNDGPLAKELQNTFGTGTMDIDSGVFKCLLLVVTMNRSTDSPWAISNNPLAHYNDRSRSDCNTKIKLYQLVRASTAAPAYFKAETLQWDPTDPEKTFTFVDGGVTPYNNPAFLLYKMATQPGYNLNWQTGEDKLLIVSVGTGSTTSAGAYNNLLKTVTQLPGNLMYAMQVDQDVNCRAIGRCTYGEPIDRELGNMMPPHPLTTNLNRHFLYARYDADISQPGLDAMGLNKIVAEDVQQMDSVKYMDQLRQVGAAAAKSVSMDHFGSFV